MRTLSRISGRLMAASAAMLALWYLCLLQTVGMVDGVMAAARQQSRPRRWPWQKRTVRDYADAYRSELATLARLQGAALLQLVQQQTRPRRWPWQKKTIRDLIDERSAEVVAAASGSLGQIVLEDHAGPRIQRRAAEVLADREWQIGGEAEALVPVLDEAFFLDKKRYVRRRKAKPAP